MYLPSGSLIWMTCRKETRLGMSPRVLHAELLPTYHGDKSNADNRPPDASRTGRAILNVLYIAILNVLAARRVR